MQRDELQIAETFESVLTDAGPISPILVTSAQAHRLLSIGTRTLWSITAPRGDLPCVMIGRAVRYRLLDLQDWCERHSQVTATPPSHSPGDAVAGELQSTE